MSNFAAWWVTSLQLAAGFALGIVASLVAWWIVVSRMRPKLEMSKINRVRDELRGCGFRYRVRVVNPSKRRLIAGVEVHARLSVRGLNPDFPRNRTPFRVPLGTSPTFPVIEPGRGRTFTLVIAGLEGGAHLRRIPADLRDRLDEISLEDLFDLGTDAFIRFVVTGEHELSGYRRTYSQILRRDDIVPGRFEPHSVLITPSDDHAIDLDEDSG